MKFSNLILLSYFYSVGCGIAGQPPQYPSSNNVKPNSAIIPSDHTLSAAPFVASVLKTISGLYYCS